MNDDGYQAGRLGPEEVLKHYRRRRGLLAVRSKISVRDDYMLSLVSAPGIVELCSVIQDDPSASFRYTMRGNAVAIITDGSSVLSYGDAGPAAVLPVIEGKAVLFKSLAGIDAFPIALREHDPARLAGMLHRLMPSFGGFAIEDIASPRSFELQETLDHLSDEDLPIPYFFNDMQGACSIVLAALRNALRVVDKRVGTIRAVITGAGGAGISVARFLRKVGVPEVTLCDRHGILWEGRPEGMNRFKETAAREFNPRAARGTLRDAMKGADLFVGLSAARTVSADMIRSMASGSIVLALAAPEPEITAAEARDAGAAVVLTGEADYRHGLNVALAFPGILRGVIDSRATRVYDEMLIAAADAIAGLVPAAELSRDRIIPRVIDLRVGPAVAEAVANAAVALGVAQADIDPAAVGERTRQLVYEGESIPHDSAYRSVERTLGDEALDLHRRYRGTIAVTSKVPLKDERTLGLIATPGVSYPVRAIINDPSTVWDYTTRGNLVAVVTDGSALLGRGGFGAEAALPAMEGKCVLYKTLAGVEAFPICLAVENVDDFVSMVKAIEPSFGAVNLEDIAAPQCFAIEKRLRDALDVPVFHDDQHGTAVIVLAALLNALRLTKRSLDTIQIALSGAGAAGIALARMLVEAGAGDVIVCDRRGILREGRAGMNAEKDDIARTTNRNRLNGGLADAMRGSEVLIGVSGPNIVTTEMIRTMAPRPIVFALSAPVPEIMPDAAYVGGAAVVGTSRPHGPNPFQNAIAFPGIMRGALDVAARDIDGPMKLAAAHALADLVPGYDLSPQCILPRALDSQCAPEVAAAVARAALASGQARRRVDPRDILENTHDYLYGGILRPLGGEPIVAKRAAS